MECRWRPHARSLGRVMVLNPLTRVNPLLRIDVRYTNINRWIEYKMLGSNEQTERKVNQANLRSLCSSGSGISHRASISLWQQTHRIAESQQECVQSETSTVKEFILRYKRERWSIVYYTVHNQEVSVFATKITDLMASDSWITLSALGAFLSLK